MTCIFGLIPFVSDFAVLLLVGDLDPYAEPKAYRDDDLVPLL